MASIESMLHIVPKSDQQEHQLNVDCACHPTSDEEGGIAFFLHNSFRGDPPPTIVGGLLDGRQWQAIRVHAR